MGKVQQPASEAPNREVPMAPNPPKTGILLARELFHRWPLVPSRELERIRHVLLHCDQLGSADTHHLSEPAQALLDLINCELERRRALGKSPEGAT